LRVIEFNLHRTMTFTSAVQFDSIFLPHAATGKIAGIASKSKWSTARTAALGIQASLPRRLRAEIPTGMPPAIQSRDEPLREIILERASYGADDLGNPDGHRRHPSSPEFMTDRQKPGVVFWATVLLVAALSAYARREQYSGSAPVSAAALLLARIAVRRPGIAG
jgi:hypothetical protein